MIFIKLSNIFYQAVQLYDSKALPTRYVGHSNSSSIRGVENRPCWLIQDTQAQSWLVWLIVAYELLEKHRYCCFNLLIEPSALFLRSMMTKAVKLWTEPKTSLEQMMVNRNAI